ncbi:Imidazoleglycerol-phosphate dehydratase [Candidatus Hodgkinia cicadicola]|nr:Imidazoleglycerol-phosphate dehydratase [Candidatus Hodgkinia cicadicola]
MKWRYVCYRLTLRLDCERDWFAANCAGNRCCCVVVRLRCWILKRGRLLAQSAARSLADLKLFRCGDSWAGWSCVVEGIRYSSWSVSVVQNKECAGIGFSAAVAHVSVMASVVKAVDCRVQIGRARAF